MITSSVYQLAWICALLVVTTAESDFVSEGSYVRKTCTSKNECCSENLQGKALGKCLDQSHCCTDPQDPTQKLCYKSCTEDSDCPGNPDFTCAPTGYCKPRDCAPCQAREVLCPASTYLDPDFDLKAYTKNRCQDKNGNAKVSLCPKGRKGNVCCKDPEDFIYTCYTPCDDNSDCPGYPNFLCADSGYCKPAGCKPCQNQPVCSVGLDSIMAIENGLMGISIMENELLIKMTGLIVIGIIIIFVCYKLWTMYKLKKEYKSINDSPSSAVSTATHL